MEEYSLIEYYGLLKEIRKEIRREEIACFESLDSEELNSLADRLGIEKEKLEEDASEYLEAMKEMKALHEKELINIQQRALIEAKYLEEAEATERLNEKINIL